MASELGFNEEKSLVDEEGEGHCSQKEQQHMQVACAVTAAPLVWMEHKGGAGTEEDMVGQGQRQVLGSLMCCAEELEFTPCAVRSMPSA